MLKLLYTWLATTFTLTLPDLSPSLVAGAANVIISGCYFAIAWLISLALWRNRQFGFDIFAIVTAGIFWTCAFGHSGHAAEYLGTAALSGGANCVRLDHCNCGDRFFEFVQPLRLLSRFHPHP
ncbi:hypothetical protein [Microcoleus vaginatus]|uniref:hypothetical protein n=1 Tax=Microcoleus vaginatus TaxID=119532 RepID=UPI00403F1D7F